MVLFENLQAFAFYILNDVIVDTHKLIIAVRHQIKATTIKSIYHSSSICFNIVHGKQAHYKFELANYHFGHQTQ